MADASSFNETDETSSMAVNQPQVTIKAGVVLSRPPLMTAEEHPFETAFHLYQRRLNERLALPFTQYFHFKKGTPAFEHWRTKRRERGGVEDVESCLSREGVRGKVWAESSSLWILAFYYCCKGCRNISTWLDGGGMVPQG